MINILNPCYLQGQETEAIEESKNTDLKAMLKDLPERKRRTILR